MRKRKSSWRRYNSRSRKSGKSGKQTWGDEITFRELLDFLRCCHRKSSISFLENLVAFVLLWAKGFAEKECLKCAFIYGLMMGLFFQTNTLVLYAVQPLPGMLMVKWFAANITEAVLAGVVAFLVYKPKAEQHKP